MTSFEFLKKITSASSSATQNALPKSNLIVAHTFYFIPNVKRSLIFCLRFTVENLSEEGTSSKRLFAHFRQVSKNMIRRNNENWG